MPDPFAPLLEEQRKTNALLEVLVRRVAVLETMALDEGFGRHSFERDDTAVRAIRDRALLTILNSAKGRG